MTRVLLIGLLAAIGQLTQVVASPAPSTYVHPPNGICTDLTVTEPVKATYPIWGLPKFESNYDVVSFLFNLSRKDGAVNTPSPVSGFQNLTKTYTVAATFCKPRTPVGDKESTVLVATHGLGYDGRYWASSYKPEEYSFVQKMLANGYSVFWYDRVGTGRSQIVSGYDLSLFDQTELIAQISKSIRAGNYTADVKASKIVLVGHSYGSITSNSVLANYGDIVDGAVLTGIAYGNYSADPFPLGAAASRWVPSAFGSRIADTMGHTFARDTGFVDFGDIYSHAQTFFYAPYDVPTVEYAQSIRQPLSILEYVTGGLADLESPNFTGPILLTTGVHDLMNCDGNCTTTYYDGGLQNATFPNANAVEVYLHPDAAHGVNFARNATGFYGEIVSFLDRNI